MHQADSVTFCFAYFRLSYKGVASWMHNNATGLSVCSCTFVTQNRPIQSHAFGVRLTHLWSISRYHAGGLKSHAFATILFSFSAAAITLLLHYTRFYFTSSVDESNQNCYHQHDQLRFSGSNYRIALAAGTPRHSSWVWGSQVVAWVGGKGRGGRKRRGGK